jgi:hypothetical protein
VASNGSNTWPYPFLVVHFVRNWLVGRASPVRGFCALDRCHSFFMAEQNWDTNEKNAVENPRATKKPYQEPAFRHERVFETMALSCGKVQATDSQCRFHRNAS